MIPPPGSRRESVRGKPEIDPIIAGQPLFGPQFVAVVLLDGTVVEPVVREAENP